MTSPDATRRAPLSLFLGGDVMTGRGLDQVLAHPSAPRLYEAWVEDAREYVRLAEHRNGPIPAPVSPAYPWGVALEVLARAAPDLRLINLETAVTRHPRPWPGKGINYRMHPANLACLQAAAIHCCGLANNHVLDWGRPGLRETLASLHAAGLQTTGAGVDRDQAERPALFAIPGKGRVLVFAVGLADSGIPPTWAAGARRPGLSFLPDLSAASARRLAARLRRHKQAGDLLILSVHWGGNWGYHIPQAQQDFAHRLIEEGGVDLLHGHSSHHPKALEVYGERLILYGCGDLLNDYEGIDGHEAYRDDLRLLYLAELEAGSGKLRALRLVPLRIARMRLQEASGEERQWLLQRLAPEVRRFGAELSLDDDGWLALSWGL